MRHFLPLSRRRRSKRPPYNLTRSSRRLPSSMTASGSRPSGRDRAMPSPSMPAGPRQHSRARSACGPRVYGKIDDAWVGSGKEVSSKGIRARIGAAPVRRTFRPKIPIYGSVRRPLTPHCSMRSRILTVSWRRRITMACCVPPWARAQQAEGNDHVKPCRFERRAQDAAILADLGGPVPQRMVLDWRGVRQAQIRGAAAAPANCAADSWRA
jgi:hypothetical protein